MDFVQSFLNYAWQIVVYAFLVWLVYYFFSSQSRLAKTIVCLLVITLALTAYKTGTLHVIFEHIKAYLPI
jgi:glycerol-3-phosphate acyltransferase PlsY